jgi:hypothetical protein
LLRKGNKDVFENRRHGAKFIYVTALASYPGLQPAEDVLSLTLPDAYVQSIAEGLDVFDIFVPVRDVAEEIERRAAQFKDAIFETSPQIGGSILGDDMSGFHEADTVTA